MKLVEVVNRGRSPLKGQAFKMELGGCDLIAGPNGSGKSTRLLAVTCGLHGLAETVTDERRDYLGPNAGTGAQVTLGFRPAEGPIKYLDRDLGAGHRTKKGKAADALAESMVGQVLVRWDLQDFAQGKTSARAAVLEAASKAAGATGAWDPEAEIQRMRANPAWVGKGFGDNLLEQAVANWRILAEQQTGSADMPLSRIPASWVEDTLTWAESEQKRLNAAKTQAAKTVQRLNSEERPVLRGTLKRALADLKAAEDALREAEAKQAVAGAAAGDLDALRESLDAKRARLEPMLARVEEFEGMEAPTKAQDALNADLEAARGKHERALERLGIRRGEAADAATALKRAQADLQADVDDMPSQASPRCFHGDTDDPTALSTYPWIEADSEQRLYLADSDSDPMHAACTGFGAFDLADVRWLLDCADALDSAGRAERMQAEIPALEQAAERAADAVKRGESMVARMAEQVKAAEEAGQAGIVWRNLKQRVEDERTQIDALTEEIQDLEVKIGEAEARAKAQEGAEDPLALLRQAVDEAKAQVSTHERAQGREDALRTAVKDRDEATDLWKQAKALRAALGEVKQRLAAAAYGPLVELAQELLDAAGVPLRFYIENADDFGAVKTDSEARPTVPFWALSTSERALVGAALAQALARITDQPWKALLLDNLEAIDGARRPGVFQALAGMVEDGRLDNVLMAMATSNPVDLPNALTSHWLGA